jgi:pimeloyl-ACP methyl ester carboxylesterase
VSVGERVISGDSPVRTMVTCSDGAMLSAQDWNSEGDGPAIVLHHGFLVDLEWNWRKPGIVNALVKTGRRVIAFDARCHGQSEKIFDPARLSRERLARDVSEVADHFGLQRYDLAGYSLGGFVAVVVAVRDPKVRRLAICGSCEQLFADQLRRVEFRTIPDALRADDPSTVTNATGRQFRALADALGSDRLPLAACFEGFNADWHISGEAVPHVRVPTLVIGGKDDSIMVGVERLTDVIPDVSLIWTEGDHLSAISQPEFAAALAEFFASPTGNLRTR